MVDIMINNLLTAYVIEIKEEVLVSAHGDKPKAQLFLNIAIPVTLNIGQEAPVYIVQEAPEAEETVEPEGPRRIM